MALTNQQVQAAYLAIIGRPAEGSAVTWAIDSFADLASLVSSIIDIRKGGDFSNSKETFVENLYQNLLGRPSDAEGKEFWLKALNDGASYAQVAQGFINAVLGQSQTEDLYKLQNKLDVAEKISAQVTNFQGGAAAEATLKALMKDVNANTTIDSIQDSVDNFVGNSVNIKTVTINPADTDPAKIEGSAENATVFNLSLDVASENPSMQQELKGSTKFADTLNVKVTSSDKETATLTGSIGTISNIQTLNITTDATIETTNLTIPAGVKNLSFTGKSNDTVNVTAAMTSLNTGGGNDKITLSAKVNSVNAGAGNDIITVNAAAKDVAMSIDGGNGENTIVLNGAEATDNFAKVSFSNIKTLAGKGVVAKSSLDNKTITIGGNNDAGAYTKGELTVKAVDGINLSQVTALETKNDSTIAITDVKSGTIKLNAEDRITETVTLVDTAKSVTVSGNASGDKVIFDWSANLSTTANLDNGLAVNKIYQTDQVLGGLSDIQALVKANQTFVANSFIVGGTKDDGYKLYQITSDIARGGANIEKAGEVKLIGTIQGDGSAAATLSIVSDNAVLTFA